MADTDTQTPKKVSPEFIQNVKKWLEVDDALKSIRGQTKALNNEKKEREANILEYLTTIDESVIDVHDGKLKKNVTKSQAPLKKETIQQALTEITGDVSKATAMTEHIIKSRPIVEKVKLKRTRNRGGKDKEDE
jgi:hypothetical protein